MVKIGKRKMASRDLISRLPNSVLAHILSFVDTKSAVTTTLLSKRWNRLWISVPNLDFDGENYNFIFVDRVLKANTVISVRSVRLRFVDTVEPEDWLASIAKRNAVNIELSFSPSQFYSSQVYRLPDCFFNQSNLVELRLQYYKSPIPQPVCFPCLKTIEFRRFSLGDEESFKNLMIGCPVLTDLVIGICEWDCAHTLYICSTSLCKFDLYVDDSVESLAQHYVVIDTPKATHLTICDRIGVSYDIRDVSLLVKASIAFNGYYSHASLLPWQKISHACKLFLELLSPQPYTSLAGLMFHNLIKLTWSVSDSEYLSFLFRRLFHCTPNLAKFVLLAHVDIYQSHCVWDEPIEVPRCFSSSLEIVKVPVHIGATVEGDEDEEYEMQMISYILKNAIVLKELNMVVFSCMDLKEENELLKTVLTLQRGSAACQVFLRK